MLGTGHGHNVCKPNPQLVEELRRLNANESKFITEVQ